LEYFHDENAMLENLHEPMISKKMEKNRTLLHYHFRSKRITGVDHDELEVARWLLERSIMVSSNNRNNGLIGPYDDHGNSPLHYLFEFRFRNIISYMQYISLIMEDMSDWVVDREQARKTSTSCAPACEDTVCRQTDGACRSTDKTVLAE
jgi:hypothetical protein